MKKGPFFTDAEAEERIFEKMASAEKEIIWWPNSDHCITVDSEREKV